MLCGNALSSDSSATPSSNNSLSSTPSIPSSETGHSSFTEDISIEQLFEKEADFIAAFEDPEPPLHYQESQWEGFKIVSDNVDKNVTPSFQRLDRPKKSFHYVHSYAVKDRVDMSTLSDDPPAACKHLACDLLPSAEDLTTIKQEFCILLKR